MANWADRLAKLAQALATAGTVPDTSISTAETDTELRLAPDGAGGVEFAAGGGEVFAATPADTAINSVTDVTIVSTGVTTATGDQLVVDAVAIISNNSGASRAYTLSLDFDGQFPAELVTTLQGPSATLSNLLHLRAVLDIRSTSLAYAVVELEMNPGVGLDEDTNMTLVTSTTAGKVWGSVAADLTGSTTVEFLIRSANATATQTLRLHNFTVRRIRA